MLRHGLGVKRIDPGADQILKKICFMHRVKVPIETFV